MDILQDVAVWPFLVISYYPFQSWSASGYTLDIESTPFDVSRHTFMLTDKSFQVSDYQVPSNV